MHRASTIRLAAWQFVSIDGELGCLRNSDRMSCGGRQELTNRFYVTGPWSTGVDRQRHWNGGVSRPEQAASVRYAEVQLRHQPRFEGSSLDGGRSPADESTLRDAALRRR